MSFLAPYRLGLVTIPILLLGWLWIRRTRRSRAVVRFTALDLAAEVMLDRTGWRRIFTTFAAFLGLVALAGAFARPVMAVPVPQERAALVVAIDVSLSMDAADVAPTRLAAAREAARSFIEIAPDQLRIGLVAFAGTALPVLAPSGNHDLVEEAIGRLGLGQGTAVGEAIYSSLEQLAAMPDAAEAPQAIVVLSDGETTAGRSELEAADAAAVAGVPVYTIVFGTENGFITLEGERIPVPAASGSLAQVADTTGGRFFETADEAGLRQILDSIGSEVGFATEDREVTDWFAAIGLLLVAAAAAGAIRWFDRMI